MRIFITVLFLAALAGRAGAETLNTDLEKLQHDWARANYLLTDSEQKQAFESLLGEAEQVVSRHPGEAEYLIWQGIIQSTYAGVKGGLGALKLAKAARDNLSQAMEVNDRALDGSAYASLGTLYANVPGWPVGFGSDKKAVQFLQKALEINPDGIEPNYFYADYLLGKKQYEQAREYYLKALKAPPLEGRPVADAGRRHLIEEALVEVQGRLN